MPLREQSEQTRFLAEGQSGTSDTGRWNVCPCGRVHHKEWRRPPTRRPTPEKELRERLYEVLTAGKLDLEENRHIARFAGDCERPIQIEQNSDRGNLFVAYKVRCRKCGPCLRARQFYWARAAMRHSEATHRAGLRTWFGTLTFTPEAQRHCLESAMMRWADQPHRSGVIPDWWDEAHCDERFRLVREEMVELTKLYWKRLRKGVKRCTKCYPKGPAKGRGWDHPPAKFKYFLVFERHKSGLPHIHWLMHETEAPILHKTLQCQWPHGMVKIVLVKGDDIRRAGFYVSKYLGKAVQARQIASLGYAKNKVPLQGK